MSQTGLTQRIDRRTALMLFGSVGLSALVTACGGATSSSSSRARRSARSQQGLNTSTGTGRRVDCVLAPEMTEGPFYIDDNLVRSDITEGRPGAALALALTIVNAASCTPIKNAVVDLWHADPSGVYSGFEASSTAGSGGPPGGGSGPTDSDRFLRGTQMSDAAGLAQFKTIYPGWYQGRAVHIHVKVHVGGNVVHTGQLFFPDAFTDTVYRAEPYASRGSPDVRNADDSIYQDGGSASTLLPTAVGAGDAATMTLGVKTG
jgi:protocatechuate 3,4-dioxygenase beta subunit